MLSDEDFYNSRILIVDDEPGNTLLLERLLKDEGYRCLWIVNDSKKAVDLYFEIHPDLVLLDLHMPPPDGFEIMRQWQEKEPDSHVPILVLTALEDENARLRALSGGARDFLNKPFDLTEVRLRIKKFIGNEIASSTGFGSEQESGRKSENPYCGVGKNDEGIVRIHQHGLP